MHRFHQCFVAIALIASLRNIMNYYNNKKLTPKTRLSDLVAKKYHPQLRVMIKEFTRLTTLTEETEWWRVRKLEFIKPRTQLNYVPIANFIRELSHNEQEGLKCSIDTFFRYITSSEHSNLTAKWKSVKAMVYSYIRYENQKEKQ